MVKARLSIVEVMAIGIAQRQGRISRIKARNSLAKWEVIKTLGVGIVGQKCYAVRHALFERSLQRVVVCIDVSYVGLHGGEGVGTELAATGGIQQRVGYADSRL